MSVTNRVAHSSDALAEAMVSEALLQNSRILVVDDHEFIRRMIKQCLTVAGFGNIEFAVDGQDGLDRLESFQPDIIVLDVNMPRVDGLEFLRRMRAVPEFRRVPVLIQTASQEETSRNDAFAAGATDFVTKPINFTELTTRLKIHLENRLLIRELKSYRDRVDSELVMARDMQRAILPEAERIEEMERRYGVRLHGHFEPSSELGGDFWMPVALDDTRLGLMNVDFSGHGIGAALNTIRLHALMSQLPPPPTDPAGYLAALNHELHRLLPRGQFATMFYGILDVAAGRLSFASAAAPAPVIGTGGGAPETHVEPSGLPLGLMAVPTYENASVPFPPGAFIFLYSDALYESPLSSGGRLGVDKVPDMVRACMDDPRPLDRLIAAFDATVIKPIPDDLTAIWVQRM